MLKLLICVVYLSVCHCESEDNLPLLLKFFHEKGKSSNIGKLLGNYESEAKAMIDDGKNDNNKETDLNNINSDKILRSDMTNDGGKEYDEVKYENNPAYENNDYNAKPIESPLEINADDKVLQDATGVQGYDVAFNDNEAYGDQNEPSNYIASRPQLQLNANRRKFRDWLTLKSVGEADGKVEIETSKDTTKINEAQKVIDTDMHPGAFVNVSLPDIKEKPILIQIPLSILINNKAKEPENADTLKNMYEVKPSVRSNSAMPYKEDAKDIALAQKFRGILQKSRVEAQMGKLRRLLEEDNNILFQNGVNLNV